MGCVSSRGDVDCVPHPGATLLESTAPTSKCVSKGDSNSCVSGDDLPRDGPPPAGPPDGLPASVAFNAFDASIDAIISGAPISSRQTPPGTARSHACQPGAGDRLVFADSQETSIMVTGFSCLDASVLPQIGKNCKSATIRIQVGSDARPVEVRFLVDTGGWGTPDVRISSGHECLFPKRGAHGARAKLKDDFIYRWPYRGQLDGLREPGRYEVWRGRLGQPSEWTPCTVMDRREDGNYRVIAQLPDSNDNMCDVEFHDVAESELRSQFSKAPIFVQERCFEMVVPREDPLQVTVGLSGANEARFFAEHLAHVDNVGCFSPSASPSSAYRVPAYCNPRPELLLRTSKGRDTVMASVGRTTLSRFLQSTPCSVTTDFDEHSRTWVVQFGPNVEHHICLERKSAGSRVFCLTIDGESFVEASSDDLRLGAGVWECSFRFIGKTWLNFEVHETDMDGNATDRKSIVEQKMNYAHVCSVAIQDELHLETSELRINNVLFQDLPRADDYPLVEPNFSMPVEQLEEEFALKVPKKVSLYSLRKKSAQNDDIIPAGAPKGVGMNVVLGSQLPVVSALLGCCCVESFEPSKAELVISHGS